MVVATHPQGMHAAGRTRAAQKREPAHEEVTASLWRVAAGPAGRRPGAILCWASRWCRTRPAQTLSVPMQIVLLMTVLTLLPAILMSVTPFLRVVVVLHFLRQALGTQTAPSNQVLVGLALFLSLMVVQPVAEQVYQQGLAAA